MLFYNLVFDFYRLFLELMLLNSTSDSPTPPEDIIDETAVDHPRPKAESEGGRTPTFN